MADFCGLTNEFGVSWGDGAGEFLSSQSLGTAWPRLVAPSDMAGLASLFEDEEEDEDEEEEDLFRVDSASLPVLGDSPSPAGFGVAGVSLRGFFA
jgi:hypothetical protein